MGTDFTLCEGWRWPAGPRPSSPAGSSSTAARSTIPGRRGDSWLVWASGRSRPGPERTGDGRSSDEGRHDRALAQYLPGATDLPDAGRPDRRDSGVHPIGSRSHCPRRGVRTDSSTSHPWWRRHSCFGRRRSTSLRGTTRPAPGWARRPTAGWSPRSPRRVAPTTTTTLAYLDAFTAFGVRHLGLLTPTPPTATGPSASATPPRDQRGGRAPSRTIGERRSSRGCRPATCCRSPES